MPSADKPQYKLPSLKAPADLAAFFDRVLQTRGKRANISFNSKLVCRHTYSSVVAEMHWVDGLVSNQQS